MHDAAAMLWREHEIVWAPGTVIFVFHFLPNVSICRSFVPSREVAFFIDQYAFQTMSELSDLNVGSEGLKGDVRHFTWIKCDKKWGPQSTSKLRRIKASYNVEQRKYNIVLKEFTGSIHCAK